MSKKIAGRLITRALRHDPDMLNLTLDKQGYCDVETLICQLNAHGCRADRELIEKIGANERFSFNEDGTKIRADYGHSLGLRLADMYPSPAEPPECLYHGTHADVLDSIREHGIVRFAQMAKARDHIFFTEDYEVAVRKGGRHGESVVLPVRARQLSQDGVCAFYHVKNDIWLTEQTVPAAYIDL